MATHKGTSDFLYWIEFSKTCSFLQPASDTICPSKFIFSSLSGALCNQRHYLFIFFKSPRQRSAAARSVKSLMFNCKRGGGEGDLQRPLFFSTSLTFHPRAPIHLLRPPCLSDSLSGLPSVSRGSARRRRGERHAGAVGSSEARTASM